MSYGIDTPDVFRLIGRYVGRVLHGENPATLPIQAPTKFRFAINTAPADAMELTLPPTLISLADEVIQ